MNPIIQSVIDKYTAAHGNAVVVNQVGTVTTITAPMSSSKTDEKLMLSCSHLLGENFQMYVTDFHNPGFVTYEIDTKEFNGVAISEVNTPHMTGNFVIKPVSDDVIEISTGHHVFNLSIREFSKQPGYFRIELFDDSGMKTRQVSPNIIDIIDGRHSIKK